jgi:glycosyltransferase involved in cell wall biosynthesis
MSLFAGLRVGLVGPLPPPAGGMAMQTRQLAALLADAGADVTLVQTNPPYRPAWLGRLPVLRALARLLPFLWALWQAAGRSDLFHVMANSGWSWHLFATPAIWIARLRGVPVVVNYRGGEAGPFLDQQGAIVRFSMARVAALCVPSGFLQAVFARHGMAAAIVPNIVDLACFHPAEARPAGARLMVARNLEPIYDNATALRALARVRQQRPDATMTIAGTGPLAAALQALATELGLQDAVTFAGRLDRQAVADALRASAVSINPSRVDNTPNSVLEALASGVPVVSTAVGGVPFIVRDGETALLVPPGDAQAMADAVLRVLADADLSQRLAQAGLREARRYAWPHVAPVLAEVYRRVAGPSATLRPCTRD